jgi:hypothetical protein
MSVQSVSQISLGGGSRLNEQDLVEPLIPGFSARAPAAGRAPEDSFSFRGGSTHKFI